MGVGAHRMKPPPLPSTKTRAPDLAYPCHRLSTWTLTIAPTHAREERVDDSETLSSPRFQAEINRDRGPSGCTQRGVSPRNLSGVWESEEGRKACERLLLWERRWSYPTASERIHYRSTDWACRH